MRIHISPLLRKALYAAVLSAACISSTLRAGHMREEIGYQFYRNLAENRNGYDAGKTNVDMYDLNGNFLGTVPVIPDFSPFADPRGSVVTLSGGQSWVVDCWHNSPFTNVEFGVRQGTLDTPVYENYKNVRTLSPSGVDLEISRLNKVVTDIVHWELAEDPKYIEDIANLREQWVWRVGSGTQVVYDTDGNAQGVDGAYVTITAGTVTPLGLEYGSASIDNARGETITFEWHKKWLARLNYTNDKNFLPVIGNAGDSGSPVIFFNEDTQSFQLIGIHYASGGNPVYTHRTNYNYYSPEMFNFIIDTSQHYFDSTETSWVISGADATGMINVSGQNSGLSINLQALAPDKRGDTSTVGERATDQELWDVLNWRLSSNEATLRFDGDVNLGAGVVQFFRGSESSALNPAEYELRSSSADVNFQTGGYIIDEHVYVSSFLTGREGDEWRIVGENARLNADGVYEIYGGFFDLMGQGNNDVDLNLGVGVTVFLNRANGYAAQDVQLNTEARVILSDANQIAGNIEFGNGGGTLDLNGHSYSRNTNNLYTFDKKAQIVNYANGSDITFTYTAVGSEESQFRAALLDGASVLTDGTGVMHATFREGVGEQSRVRLDNHVRLAGDLRIEGVDTTLSGYQIEIANPDQYVSSWKENYTPIFDPNKWETRTVNVRNILVSGGANITLGSAVDVVTNELRTAAGSELVASGTARFTGNMVLGGNARFEDGFTMQGSATVQSGVTLDVLGGLLNISLHNEAGGTVNFSNNTEQLGSVQNEGAMSFRDEFSLGQTMNNSGSMSFDSLILMDVTQMQGEAVEGGTLYRVFTGNGSASFDSLSSSNIVGEGSEDLLWTFYSDGRLIASTVTNELQYTGGTLNLRQNEGGFDSGSSSLRFSGAQSTVNLSQADLSVRRFFVDGSIVSLVSNGHQLHVDRLLLADQSTLRITGDALNAETRITQQNGSRNMRVAIDMQQSTFSGKNWLSTYTGDVTLYNGTYDTGSNNPAFRSLNIASDAAIITREMANFDFALEGSGTVRAMGVDNVYFTQVENFSGTIDAGSATVHIQGVSRAGMHLEAEENLYLSGTINSMGAITGTGRIHVANVEHAQVSGLENFDGHIISTADRTTLGGVMSLQSISHVEGSTLALAEGAEVTMANTTTRGIRWVGIDLGAGSHFNEGNTQLHFGGGNVNIGGSGLYTIKGFTLSGRNAADTLNINGDVTVHIIGQNHQPHNWGTGSFQLSTWSQSNVINLSGTLISEAAISNLDGNGTINIRGGGTLELKRGGTYNSKNQQGTVNVEGGGTLLLGQQSNTTDYGSLDFNKRLNVNMSNNSTLGGSGTGTIDIYHSLQAEADTHVNILAEQGQHLHMHNKLTGLDAHIIGDGEVTVYHPNEANRFEVDSHMTVLGENVTLKKLGGTGELTFQDASTLQITQLDGFTGSVNTSASQLILGGQGTFSDLTWTAENVEILAGAQIKANNINNLRWRSGYSISLGEGAHFDESSVQVKMTAGTTEIGGSGTYTVKGIALSASNGKSIFNINGDATLNIVGTGHANTSGADGSFQISTWSHHNEINIYGSLISEAGISSRDGSAQINVHDGGLLELKSGPIFNYNSARVSSIQVRNGGTLALGNQSNTTDYGASSRSGRLEIHLHDGATLAASGTGTSTVHHSLIITEGSNINFRTAAGQDLNIASSLANIHARVQGAGSLSLVDKNFTSGSLSVEQSATLNLLGGQYDVALTVGVDASANISGTTSITGLISNAGSTSFSNQVTLGQSISNSGSLIFDSNVLLDLSMLSSTETADGTSYQIFSGGHSLSFAELSISNITGAADIANEELHWVFVSDGRILRLTELPTGNLSFTGGELHLVENAVGFALGQRFTSGDSIDFSGAAANMQLGEANLHVAQILVDSTSLSINSNGHELAVDNLSLNSGASLEIMGNALAADVVINQVDATRNTHVTLNMAGATTSGKSWLNSYTGELLLRNGVYDIGEAAAGYQSLHLEADAGIIMRTAQPVASAISGSGNINIVQSGTAELNNLNGFTGRISSNSSTLRLGGQAELSSLSWGANGTLELLANAQISSRIANNYRWGTGYSIMVGEGAHFDESSVQLRINGGTVNIGGTGGTYSVRGIGLSASNHATTLNIQDGATVHLTGTRNDNSTSADGTFQISTWNRTNTINIAGTLISEAGISSRDGNANINILEGGLLELKRGPIFNYNSARVSTIQVQNGGTLALGNQSNTTDYGASSSNGRLEIHLHDGATLTTSGTADVTLYHSLISSADSHVNLLTKAGQTWNIASTLSNTNARVQGGGILSFSDKTITNSSLSLEGSSTLNLQSGQYDIALHVGAGATANITGTTSITGLISNEGSINFSNQLTLSQSITNSGSLVFDSNVVLDLSLLTGAETAEGLEYQFFSGGLSNSFAGLGVDNLTGIADLDIDPLYWVFNSDGRIVKLSELPKVNLSFAGGTLNLAENVGGFGNGRQFTSGESIDFSGVATTMRLDEANLHVAELRVVSTSLSINSNGHELAVDSLSLNSGASLELIGNALAADVVIAQADGTRNTDVILDMEGATTSGKSWISGYTGNLRLRDGVYDIGEAAVGYQSLHIESDGGIIMRNAQPVSSAISGSGSISIEQSGMAELNNLNGFTGRISSNSSTLRLGGQADLSTVSWAANGTLEILANAQISSGMPNNYRWGTGYSVMVGEGAHFDESSVQLRINGGTVNLGGVGGTYSIKGIGLSAGNNATTLNIQGGSTVHITGTTNHNMSNADGSFQISTWNRTNTINIAGTLISEAGISSRDGNANINILDGGLLELKRGPIFNYNTARVSTIQVQGGGTLALGNQSDTTDYGASSRNGRLEIHLHNGATLTASGTEDVTIHHSLISSAGSEVNFLTKAGQNIYLNSSLSDIHAHVAGAGSLHVQQVGAAKTFSVSAAELHFGQGVSLDHVVMAGNTTLHADGALSTARISSLAGGHSLNIDSSITSLNIGATELVNNRGGMSIATLDAAASSNLKVKVMRNIHLSNASITGGINIVLNKSKLTNIDLNDTSFKVNSGESLIENSIINQGTVFTFQSDSSQLTIVDSVINVAHENAFLIGSGVTNSIDNMLTITNSSVQASVTTLESLDGNNYHIGGISRLLQMATIEGVLFLDLEGIDLDALVASGQHFSFTVEGLTDNMQLNQIVLRGDSTTINLAGELVHANAVTMAGAPQFAAVNQFSVVPEPSTATLSLLALAGLLARRRRKANS